MVLEKCSIFYHLAFCFGAILLYIRAPVFHKPNNIFFLPITKTLHPSASASGPLSHLLEPIVASPVKNVVLLV